MNGFICRLTGGHKYDDCNQKIEQCPDDTRILWVSNFCTKCGAMHFWIMDVDDIKEMAVEGRLAYLFGFKPRNPISFLIRKIKHKRSED